MADIGLDADEFTAMAKQAIAAAREETLNAGIPVFYRDRASKIDVMEMPDGRKFEVRFLPGLPRNQHYEVVRELGKSAA